MEKRKEKETKFRIFRCAICGEIFLEISGESKTLMCCGQKMEELIPQTIDELKEKVAAMKKDLAASGRYQSDLF